MFLGKIFSNISNKTVDKTLNQKTPKDLQKENNDLLYKSMEGISSEALANTAKGSFQAMQNLQDLNRQLQEQIQKNNNQE